MKTLEEFDFAQAPRIPAAKIRELAEGGYIERSEPVPGVASISARDCRLPIGRKVAFCSLIAGCGETPPNRRGRGC